MRFLLLLLPNLYDIFTLLMIGYAFILKNNSQLELPILTACLLIYTTTRIGIIAGELVNKIINPLPDAQGIEEPAEVVAKRMIMGVIPQCILIIICQVVFALFFLQHPASVKNVVPSQVGNLPEQVQQNEFENNNGVNQIEKSVPQPEAEILTNTNQDNDEEVVQPPVAPKVTKKTSVARSKKTVTVKKSTENTLEVEPQNNVYYEIPSRTLRAAGISPESSQQANQTSGGNSKSIVPVQNNSNSWTFSASKTAQITKSTVNNNAKQVPAASLNPKRYPGDDNPLNANWGYYKYTETQTKPVTQKPVQQTSPMSNIPATTLRSIGY